MVGLSWKSSVNALVIFWNFIVGEYRDTVTGWISEHQSNPSFCLADKEIERQRADVTCSRPQTQSKSGMEEVRLPWRLVLGSLSPHLHPSMSEVHVKIPEGGICQDIKTRVQSLKFNRLSSNLCSIWPSLRKIFHLFLGLTCFLCKMGMKMGIYTHFSKSLKG